MSIKMRKLKRMRAKRHMGASHLAHHVDKREFSGIAELQRHMEKAAAFQREIDTALAWKDQSDALTKLELERKRQAFLRLRDENYIASLRLEGFDVASDNASTTLEALRKKYAR